ncbi:hypothetical protein VKT23_019474 [Stygiomarasmius scandens]|uniref:SET domain-containing protein n=1 Tax=Marasmiellus scandens TaxID=2682957 RepID=A0ABR1IQP7_9AGAR
MTVSLYSCRPNALQDWDSPSFSLQLRASRDIKKDEEIFISYIPAGIMDPAPTRQERLEPYRFKCNCQACSNPIVSDERCRKIEEVGVLRRTIEVNGNDMGWVQEQLINPSLECMKLMEEEGLQCEELYRVSLLRLAENYSFLGDTVEETKWRRMYDASCQVQCSARNPMNEATRIKEETERRAQKEVLAKISAKKGQSFVVEL